MVDSRSQDSDTSIAGQEFSSQFPVQPVDSWLI